ncbi:AMP phosphorylase [uncultured archaeon]|nr:AMP phosphorylase [uncultured archaeon]
MKLKVKVMDVEQGQQEIVLNQELSHEMCLETGERVIVKYNGNEITCIIDESRRISKNTIILYHESAQKLNVKTGQMVDIRPAIKPAGIDYIKKKIRNESLNRMEITEIIANVLEEKLSNAELSAFITSIEINGMSPEETLYLTEEIYNSGEHMEWNSEKTVSIHSVGGVSGDRITMLATPILATLGYTVPKTATRAISSASGTIDAMEVLCNVTLNKKQIMEVIKKTKGCVAWGGAVNLAIADDKLIKIRNPLQLDPQPLVLSSIMAKKKAEGAKHVLIDVPFGRGAKILDLKNAEIISKSFRELGKGLGINTIVTLTDGSKPVLNEIGPSFEAKAVLEILEGKRKDKLYEKAVEMTAILYSNVEKISLEKAKQIIVQTITSGKALKKFQDIIIAQGGKIITSASIKHAKIKRIIKSTEHGIVSHLDNKNIARIARALGAPGDKQAGLIIKVATNQRITPGTELYEIYANSQENINEALRLMNDYRIIELQRLVYSIE